MPPRRMPLAPLSPKPLQRTRSLVEILDQSVDAADEAVKVKQERNIGPTPKDDVEESKSGGSDKQEKKEEEMDELQSSQASGDSIESWSLR
ncbi:hypothetical protein CYLTODRAFT_419166 [Cylindrobasidium torrendii FP15055 ss-10]|uniref:Uncharacterized protein n=1 Tax=Cylindrobasidium torrendii FP15055 ss-10 TaxID=1314674 RepID=A0A0D7BKR3_9AGAR|nr:hypothetical protein CYLTODRAFT_419166 [Cylindrobasidium torrendii FP15055 ss-10]